MYRTHPTQVAPRAGEQPSRRDYLVLIVKRDDLWDVDIYDKFNRAVTTFIASSHGKAERSALERIDSEIRRRLHITLLGGKNND